MGSSSRRHRRQVGPKTKKKQKEKTPVESVIKAALITAFIITAPAAGVRRAVTAARVRASASVAAAADSTTTVMEDRE